MVAGTRVFREHLIRALPDAKIQAAGSQLVLADEGTFYEQRAISVNGYRLVRWYCTRGERAPICAWRIHLVPDSLIAVGLPCGLEAAREVLGEQRARRLALYSTVNNYGRWDAQLYGLTVGLLGEAAEAVAELLLARKLEKVPWPPAPKEKKAKWWFWRQMRQEQARARSCRKKAEKKARRKRR
jgi:hypothetical protein